MTGSATRWTPNPTASTLRSERPIIAPQVEPLSPILKPVKVSLKKTTNKQPQKPEAPKRSKTPARNQCESQRTRAGSTTSPANAGPYRSQSVISHADELSMDNEGPGRQMKQEVATPRGVENTEDTTADEGTSRQRRGTLREAQPSIGTKRKRRESIEVREPSGPATHVLWTRAFPKISASALESVSGHRNASTFAVPVKERDAPGYKDLILRPQDLKTIRSAITAGNRAASAAAPDDQGQSSMWLPISEDLIPPKGIINYAQLEKELMRMFANAIMFNADPDRGFGHSFSGAKEEADNSKYEIDENRVVKDTRAMFMDVERVVGSLRSAERRSEEVLGIDRGAEDDEVDELAGDGENHSITAKRRRKA